jgi:hypothetical protein
MNKDLSCFQEWVDIQATVCQVWEALQRSLVSSKNIFLEPTLLLIGK